VVPSTAGSHCFVSMANSQHTHSHTQSHNFRTRVTKNKTILQVGQSHATPHATRHTLHDQRPPSSNTTATNNTTNNSNEQKQKRKTEQRRQTTNDDDHNKRRSWKQRSRMYFKYYTISTIGTHIFGIVSFLLLLNASGRPSAPPAAVSANCAKY